LNHSSPLRSLCQTALLVALEIVLNRFCSINTMGLKIGISFIPIALCAMALGPGWAAGAWGVADLLGAMLFPVGPYHPGFTLCAAAMGFVYALFLHPERPVRWQRIRFFPNVVCAAFINTIVLGLFVNTIWIAQLYGSRTYWGWFALRAAQYLVLLPAQLIILPLILKLSDRLRAAGLVGGGKT